MKSRDVLSGLFLFLLGGVFVIGSLGHSVWDRYGPGPGFFPLMLGGLFSLLSLALILSRALGFAASGEVLAQSDSLKPSQISKTLGYLLLLVFFYLLFGRLGSVLTIFAFMIIVMVFLNRRSLGMSVTISAVTAILVYVVFVRLLGVTLPGGILKEVVRFY